MLCNMYIDLNVCNELLCNVNFSDGVKVVFCSYFFFFKSDLLRYSFNLVHFRSKSIRNNFIDII